MILSLPGSAGLIIRSSDGTVEHFPARIAVHLILVPRATEWECVRVVSQN